MVFLTVSEKFGERRVPFFDESLVSVNTVKE